jgi:hypothetical protein
MDATPIDIAIIREMSELTAAQSLTAQSKTTLTYMCDQLGVRRKKGWEKIDLIFAIMSCTHPTKQAQQQESANTQLSFL